MLNKIAGASRRIFCWLAGASAVVVPVFAGYSDILIDSNGNIFVNDTDKRVPGSMSAEAFVPRYASLVNFGLAILAITSFLIMLFQFARLGNAGDDEKARKRAISGILMSGISLALFGSLAVVVSIFSGLLKV